ncbi:hypothetical protein SAMN05421678_108237 [Actinopolymorpha cephalotaxi]|uniref:Uncharacterized protein n=1 Tax=Actinopolymorpha cephalotaxi TaxID=504797 RepID=A0A1I2UMB0_9ACTN|nr:hypothetical protein [Actinopolymorpha cephalotaxi]NYH86651.1 hypothetical protein [Actinopolymorpha cephalotaxi]SFG78168.1 hypothetical protein SAMN05421678_108237 [Actinopolymorpha cephalotaxi]
MSGEWVKYSCDLAWAMSTIGSVERRLIDLAVLRVNAIGHAEFGSGELARLLSVMDPITGEVVHAVTERHVRRAVEGLRGLKVIEPDSSVLCLHFDAERLCNGTSGHWCHHHGIGRAPKLARQRRRT